MEGGIKNALERGQTLAQAKQTFINAGYTPAEVNAAVQKISPSVATAPVGLPSQQQVAPIGSPPPIAAPQGVPAISPKQSAPPVTPGQPVARQVAPKKGLSRIWVIIMIIISLLILVGAAGAGLYWDKLFGG